MATNNGGGNKAGGSTTNVYVDKMLVQNVNVLFQSNSPAPHEDPNLSPDSDEEDNAVPDNPQLEQFLDSTQEVTKKHLQKLSQDIGGHWKAFVRELGVSEAEIDYTHHQYHTEGIREVVYQLLILWKQNSEHRTVSTIAHALRRCGVKKHYFYLILGKFIGL